MRILRPVFAALAFCLIYCADVSAQFPSPTFNNVTAQGNVAAATVNVSGATAAVGGGSLIGTFGGPTVLTNVTPTLVPTTIGALPAVSPANQGQMAYASDCLNSTQMAPGTGCPYFVNSNGVWQPMPSVPTLAITVGGQQIFLGGSTVNQGNGSKLQLATGSFVVGHAPAYDNNGNLIDSGVVPSGGTGGGGTVAAAPQNSIPFYTNAGSASTVAGLPIVNNAVLITSGGGVPSEATTLPSGLTIPGAILPSPVLSGTITIGSAAFTGKQTFAASTLGAASINIPAGVVPTTPVNGDIWSTTSGLFERVNGSTQGPFVYFVSTAGPLGGGGVGPALALTCNTCATTTNGGLLTGTAPMTINASGVISLGLQPVPAVWIADSATVVHNDLYNLIESWPYVNPGTVNSVVYHTGGTTSPAFTIAVQVNGVNVGTCNGLSVSSATDTTTVCTSTPIAAGQKLQLNISGVTGNPFSSVIQVNVSRPAS